jgi:hypothetical protein
MTVSSLWLCRWYGPPSEEVAYAQLIEEIALEDYIHFVSLRKQALSSTADGVTLE